MNDDKQQQQSVSFIRHLQRAANAMRDAKIASKTILAQTVYLGTLGILLVVPPVAGAYLGAYLDEKLNYFSFSWTLSLILIGVFFGAMSVYLFIKDNE